MQFFDSIFAQRERWIHWVPVLIGTGIGVYFTLRFEPPLWLGLFAFVLAGAGFILLRPAAGRIFCVSVLLIITGFATAQLRTHSVAHPVLEKESRVTEITGTVLNIERLPSGSRLLIQGDPYRMRLSLRGDRVLPEIGAEVKMLAVLKPPSPPVSPGAFDFQRHAYFKQIGAYGFGLSDPETITPAVRDRFSLWVSALRRQVGGRIQTVLGTGNTGAVTTALLTGDRHLIPEERLEDIRKAGIAHLLAISGLHIGLVAGFIFFVVRGLMALSETLALRLPIKKIAALIALLSVLAYMLLVGAPLPTQRAVFMSGIVLLAVMVDRTAISLRLAALAAALILLILPESLVSASFQMSFSAVVALIAVYEVLTPYLAKIRRGHGAFGRLALYVLGLVLTTVIATLATAPFALFYFQRVALLGGLLANMLAVPLTGFVVMPAGVLALLLMPFGWDAVPLQVMGWGVTQILTIAQDIAAFDFVLWHLPAWPVAALIWLTLAGLWLAFWRGPVRLAGLVFVIPAVIIMTAAPQPDILAAAKGKIMAVRSGDGGLMVSTLRREKFIRENWAERAADQKPEVWPETGKSADGMLSCDAQACLYRAKNHTVSIVHDPLALPEDCARADYILATVPVKIPCKAKVLADLFDLKRNGAHAVYLQKDGSVMVRSVNEVRGDRPWVQ